MSDGGGLDSPEELLLFLQLHLQFLWELSETGSRMLLELTNPLRGEESACLLFS